MIQLVLTGLLIVLCFVWFVRQANAESNPSAADMAGHAPKSDYWMLAAFAVLIIGIVLTG